MRFTILFSVWFTGCIAAPATTHKVNVGKGGLVFEPNDLAGVEPGSFIEFTFFPKNHTVTQSSFAQPCVPLQAPANSYSPPPQIIHSGFVPTPPPGPNNQTFTIQIRDDKPIWLYCAQTIGNHCQQGMAMSINAPREGEKTFAKYLAIAKLAQTPSRVPEGGVQGGILRVSAPDAGSGTSGQSASISTISGEVRSYTTATLISTLATSTYTDATTTWTREYPTVVQTVTIVVTTGLLSSPSAVSTKTGGEGGGSTSATSTLPVPTGGAYALCDGRFRVWWLVIALGAGVGALGVL